jgi:hypothetical protein
VNVIPVKDARKAALARFDALRERLEPELNKLLDCTPHTRIKTAGVKHVPVPKAPGVYLFSEDGKDLYVGRSKEPQRPARPAHAGQLRAQLVTVRVQHRQARRAGRRIPRRRPHS